MISLVAACLLLLAWGAFAFGAVYPWGYWPLVAGSSLLGIVLWRRGYAFGRQPRLIVVLSIAMLALAIGCQLIPLPTALLERWSPFTVQFLSKVHLGFAQSPVPPVHPLSIQPRQSALGLILFVGFGILLVGASIGFRTHEVSRLVRGLATLGFVIAVINIVQVGGSSDRVYGFWQPYFTTRPGAPFVNRNHAAGWFLLAIPLIAGYLAGLISVTPPHRSWRHRVLWLTVGPGAQVTMLAFAIVVMVLSMVLTMSRSGMLAFVAVVLVFGVAALLSRRSSAAFSAFITAGILVGGVGLWAGVDRILARFDTLDVTMAQRLTAWSNALQITRDFFPFGSGLNTYGMATLVYETPGQGKHFAEAHNDYIQLIAEGGILVGLPAAFAAGAVMVLVTRAISRARGVPRDYWLRVGAAAGLLGIGLQEVVEFSLQMPGNAVLFSVVIAIAIRESSSAGSQPAN